MRIKENKEKKFSQIENKNYKDLGYKSSLCKESRFKSFWGQYVVNRWIEYVGVRFSWKTWSSKKSIDVILVSVFLKISEITFSILRTRFCLSLVNLGQCRKKWFHVSTSKPQVQKGLSVSKKLCLNLCALKWLRPTWRRVRKNSAFGWLTL